MIPELKFIFEKMPDRDDGLDQCYLELYCNGNKCGNVIIMGMNVTEGQRNVISASINTVLDHYRRCLMGGLEI